MLWVNWVLWLTGKSDHTACALQRSFRQSIIPLTPGSFLTLVVTMIPYSASFQANYCEWSQKMQEVNCKQEPHVKCQFLAHFLALTDAVGDSIWHHSVLKALIYTVPNDLPASYGTFFHSFHIGKKLSMQHEAGHFTCRSPLVCNRCC